MPHPVRSVADAIHPWLVETRRTIHMNPEFGYEEHQTSALVAQSLESWGIEVKKGVAETGVVGLLRTGREGPTIGIRADMDALPIEEANDVPYKSRQEGKMHACGHDAHTTMLLGTARILAENPDLLGDVGGNVKFLFQPAEEGRAGGRRMVEEGVLDDPHVDLVIAGHVLPSIPVGNVAARSGPVLANTDKFRITVVGRGSHAAHPYLALDPVLTAAHIITALQGVVSRNVDPMDSVVLSVTRVQTGTTFNVIPDEATIEGTLRTMRQETRAMASDRIGEIARGVASGFSLEARYEFMEGYPSLINHPGATSLIEDAAREVLGEEHLLPMAVSLGGEDFAYMARQRPGALFRVGIRNEERGIVHGLHSNRFDVDEDALPVGASVFVQAVRTFLANPGKYTD